MSRPPVKARTRPREPETPRAKVYQPGKAVPGVRPSAALRAYYTERLEREVDAMQASIVYWLKAQWHRDTPTTVANDASPERELRDLLRKRGRLWRGKFRKMAEELSKEIARRGQRHVDQAMEQILKDNGVSIEFRMTRQMRAVVQATISEQVNLISDIADRHLTNVDGAVMRSIQQGQDLHQLTNELEDTLGVTRRRAAFIARDQTNKTTATLARQRGLDLGCTEGEWLHSAGGKKPRPEHVAFSGKRYSLAKGAHLEGKWTHPGVEPNCRCVSRLVLPSLADLEN